jgi:hypothetical protein
VRADLSDSVVARGMLTVLRHFNWTNVGVIHAIDPYASGYAQVMAQAAAESDSRVNIVSTVSFHPSDAAGAEIAVNSLARAGVNVFIIIVFDSDSNPASRTQPRHTHTHP